MADAFESLLGPPSVNARRVGRPWLTRLTILLAWLVSCQCGAKVRPQAPLSLFSLHINFAERRECGFLQFF